jgi:hypothetical protein
MLWLVLWVVDQYCIRRILIHDPPPRSCYICWSITTSLHTHSPHPPPLLVFSLEDKSLCFCEIKNLRKIVLTIAYIEKAVHFSSLGLFETTYEEKDWISLTGLLLVCVYLSHSRYESYLVWVTLRLPRFFTGTPYSTHILDTQHCCNVCSMDIFTLC